MTRRLAFLMFVSALMLGACSGPPQTTAGNGEGGPATDPDPEDPEDRPSVAEVETFDASQYPVRPTDTRVDVGHQVPPRLLHGQADEGMQRTIEGFRIQVFSTQDQERAQDFREQVRQWWEENRSDAPELLSDVSIDVEYSQPYYRVRLGAFANRETAEEALSFVLEEFPDAFLARATVTVTR